MNRLSNWRSALQVFGALALAFAFSVNALPQHEGHDMKREGIIEAPKAMPGHVHG